jgi:hypothetical protein
MYTEGWSITPSNPSKISNSRYRSTSSTSTSARYVSVVTDFLIAHAKEEEDQSSSGQTTATTSPPQRKRKIPRSERKAMERDKKARNKNGGNNAQRRQQQQQQQRSKDPTYKLHSTAVSQLTAGSTAEDVLRAIKRAQKLHDHHDLRVIANFLIDECDVGTWEREKKKGKKNPSSFFLNDIFLLQSFFNIIFFLIIN